MTHPHRPALFPILAAVALVLPSCGMAAIGDTPSQGLVDKALRQASKGRAIVLPAGNYGEIMLAKRDMTPPVTIDARAATFTKLTIRNSSGITIEGGTVIGTGGRSYGISILEARDITIRSMTITAAHRGIVIDRSRSITIANNRLVGLISDGVDIAYSQGVTITDNVCRDFNPTPAVFDDDGNRLRDGDHPDCIQAWSRPQYPPTSDLRIERNLIDGQMQGIFLGNHVRNGIDDGGFDRVVIRDNRVTAGLPNAIYAAGVRGGEIMGNQIATVPGAVLHKGPVSKPVRAKLFLEGVGVRACGNRVANGVRSAGTDRC